MTAANARPRRVHKARDRLLLRWHRWLGLGALVFLLLAAFSGSLLVYKQALIKQLITPRADLPADYGVAQMALQLDAIAERIKGDNSGYLIKAPNTEEPYWALTRDADRSVQLLALDSLQAYEENLWLLQALSFFRHLHTELFAGVVGEAVLFASGVLGLFLAISGVILWWPTKRSFRWRWVFPRQIKLSYLMHYHRHAGTLVTPVLLIILLTGSIMLWQKLTKPLLVPPPSSQLPQPIPAAASATAGQLLLQAQQQVADGWPTYIRLPAPGMAAMSVRYRLPDEWHPNGRTSVKIELPSGIVTLSARADQVDWPQRLINQNYPLHSGYGMHPFYRLLILVGGITLFWLSLTGGWSFLRRHH